tara:strand:+ start:586 stop:792 length:207 start_codon:yes stop_codon:yes gene_type:complete
MGTSSSCEIDLGLAVLSVLLEPGMTVTRGDLAEVCGCSKYRIEEIEKQALKRFERLARQKGLHNYLDE